MYQVEMVASSGGLKVCDIYKVLNWTLRLRNSSLYFGALEELNSHSTVPAGEFKKFIFFCANFFCSFLFHLLLFRFAHSAPKMTPELYQNEAFKRASFWSSVKSLE